MFTFQRFVGLTEAFLHMSICQVDTCRVRNVTSKNIYMKVTHKNLDKTQNFAFITKFI
jgi:hypothetical protein